MPKSKAIDTVETLAALCALSDSSKSVASTLRKHSAGTVRAVAEKAGLKIQGRKSQIIHTLASFAGMRETAKQIGQI